MTHDESVDHIEADVVPGMRVFISYVAQAGDKVFHKIAIGFSEDKKRSVLVNLADLSISLL
jgi:hypothetical protein